MFLFRDVDNNCVEISQIAVIHTHTHSLTYIHKHAHIFTHTSARARALVHERTLRMRERIII